MFINAVSSINLKPSVNNVSFKSVDEQVIVRDRATGRELEVKGIAPNGRTIPFVIHKNNEWSTNNPHAPSYVACFPAENDEKPRPYLYADASQVCACDEEGNPIAEARPPLFAIDDGVVAARLTQLGLAYRGNPMTTYCGSAMQGHYLATYPETEIIQQESYFFKVKSIETDIEVVEE